MVCEGGLITVTAIVLLCMCVCMCVCAMYLRAMYLQVLPQKCLQVFTPSELALLLSGVTHIDVDDWQKNTRVSARCLHSCMYIHTHACIHLPPV